MSEVLDIFSEMCTYAYLALNFLYDFLKLLIPLITIYLLHLRFFSQKIKVVDSQYSSNLYCGKKISFSIENKSLSPISIKKISLVSDNRYIIDIATYPNFLILKPWEAMAISYDFSYVPEDMGDISPFSDKFLTFHTSRGNIISKFRGKIKKPQNYQHKDLPVNSFKGVIYSKEISHVLMYGESNKLIFISNKGFMSDHLTTPDGFFNCLTPETIRSKEAMELFFKNYFEPQKKQFVIYKLKEKKGSGHLPQPR